MTSIALLVIGDGRKEYLQRTMQAAREHLDFSRFSRLVMVNDSGDPEHAKWLDKRFPDFQHIHHPERKGLAAAVQSGWRAFEYDSPDLIFHLEEDFVLAEDVDLDMMAAHLLGTRSLAQVVLKRQPVNNEEQVKGGIIECAPEEYQDLTGWDGRFPNLTLHRRIFSLNPCMYRIDVAQMGWPNSNEAGFTQMCLERGYRFAFYGHRDDPPRCIHIGARRSDQWTE